MTTRRWRTLRLALLAGQVMFSSIARAQGGAVQLKPSTACRGCQVRLSTVATLSDSVRPIDIKFPRIARDAKGQFLVGGISGTLEVFDERGQFLRSFGRQGAGPGEFRQPVAVLSGRQDSLMVDDMALRRVTVTDPRLSKSVRSFPVPAHVDALALNSGRLVLSGYVPTSQRAGLPLHLVEVDGRVTRSFGIEAPVVRENPERMLSRYLSRHPEQGFIAAHTHQYVFEVWSDDLRLLKTYARDVAWFPPVASRTQVDFVGRSPMPAQLFGVVTSVGSRTVFAVSMLAAREFKADPRLKGTTGELSFMPPNPIGLYVNKYVDTILEAIDLESGTVLATIRVPGAYAPISHSPYFWILRERADGEVVIEILKAEMVRR